MLSTHPDVRAVAVVAAPRPGDGRDRVWRSSSPTASRRRSTELRAFAEDRLARYKLPEAIAVVDALPLTAGEKLDRRALARDARRGTLRPVGRVRRGMELDFDPDQEDLRDSVRAFLTAECPIALVREIVEARIAGRHGRRRRRCTPTWPSSAGPRSPSRPPPAGSASERSSSRSLAEELGRALAPGTALRHGHASTSRSSGRSATPEQVAALLAPVAEGVAGHPRDRGAERARSTRPPPP